MLNATVPLHVGSDGSLPQTFRHQGIDLHRVEVFDSPCEDVRRQTRPRAYLEDAWAQVDALQHPRNDSQLGGVLPMTSAAIPAMEAIHWSVSPGRITREALFVD